MVPLYPTTQSPLSSLAHSGISSQWEVLYGSVTSFSSAIGPKEIPTSPISAVAFSPSVSILEISSPLYLAVSTCSSPYSSFNSCQVSSQLAHVSGIPTLSIFPSSVAFFSISSTDNAFGSSIDTPLLASPDPQAAN